MRHTLLIFVISFFLVSCASTEKEDINTISEKSPTNTDFNPSAMSEVDIHVAWEGKSAKELVEKYGKPDSIINATLLGGPASEAYVYEGTRVAGNSSCINVYVVGMSNDIIIKYFCR